ncbi:AAA family ATPase [Streptomyces sp. NPDC088785]|uniref:AAA family ATPase n=1 Tax=Streptomyces sp. NPDC088785 TaxID=3365897 RepID=UPI00382EBCE9
MYPRFTVTPYRLLGDLRGWELHRDGRYLDCHRPFGGDLDREAEAATGWAEQIIGARQEWRHTRVGGPDRWTAVHGPHEDTGTAAADTDLLRSLTRDTLLVAVGSAGAGKSTFAALVDTTVVSLDALRREISGCAGDQTVTPAAVERQHRLLDRHLAAGTPVFLDSTNVEGPVRAGLVAHAQRHGRPIVAVRFLVHLDICRLRNASRPAPRRVPDDVLVWQHVQMREATPQALIAQGFTAAHDVAVSIP